jgi:hypothetical protein
MLREFQDEISKLKAQLTALGGTGDLSSLNNVTGAVNPSVV